MAIIVLKRGNNNIAKCGQCKSKLRYDWEDVESEYWIGQVITKTIICPVCNKKIYL